MANLIEMIKSNDLLKLALVLLGVYLFVNYMKKESMENVDHGMYSGMPSEMMVEGVENVSQGVEPEPVGQQFIQLTAPPQVQKQEVQAAVAPKQQLNADELLPQYDEENEFAKQNPVSDLLKEQNFLISGYHVGINTVMQSNKIPYHDLRSAPPIPKESVGPFLNSSYEVPAGTGRRFLEIGS